MTRKTKDGARAKGKAAWSVVVVYEDPKARERAVGFCDKLVQRLWASVQLDVSWWSFDLLEEPSSASTAAERAAGADLIVFSATPEGEFPLSIKVWIDAWLNLRGAREGKLVGLLEPAVETTSGECQRHHHLRKAAHRGAMDYLTEVPQDISLAISESFDSYTQRACQVTSLLDDILHQQSPPPTPLPST
jgi:hypothetical protein